MLASMVKIATYLNGITLPRIEVIDESRRAEVLVTFTTRSAQDYEQELAWLAEEYESTRKRMSSGYTRTGLMTSLVSRVHILGAQRGTHGMAEKLFSRGTDGARIVGLALAIKDPRRQYIELALSGIAESRSAFEQFHALLLAKKLTPSLHPTAMARLKSAIQSQVGKTIGEDDPSRWSVAQDLLEKLGHTADSETPIEPKTQLYPLRGKAQMMLEIKPSSSGVRYDDVGEAHGPSVNTRGVHSVRLPPIIRMGRYLITNSAYLEFVEDQGYQHDEFWETTPSVRRGFVTLDGKSMGPANWPTSQAVPLGKEEHPVTSISFLEAQAFVKWCNSTSGNPDSPWSLPTEDQWEFVARTELGFIYPWGDAFDRSRCNTSESGIGDTSEVTQFETGASKAGCCDMAGNVWEFVLAADPNSGSFVLRGGSFKNDRFLVRSYLRLFSVPPAHRPTDFGFRLVQVERPAEHKNPAMMS
jgi:formylglycine-generating enzyme required for sulfatase activity